VIIGASFTGADVSEWLHAATIAIVGSVLVEELWRAVAVFPSRSEVWLRLLEAREANRSGVKQRPRPHPPTVQLTLERRLPDPDGRGCLRGRESFDVA
jgi:hypothetical protein